LEKGAGFVEGFLEFLGGDAVGYNAGAYLNRKFVFLDGGGTNKDVHFSVSLIAYPAVDLVFYPFHEDGSPVYKIQA